MKEQLIKVSRYKGFFIKTTKGNKFYAVKIFPIEGEGIGESYMTQWRYTSHKTANNAGRKLVNKQINQEK